MRIEIRTGSNEPAKANKKQRFMLGSDVILKYLLTDDDKTDTLIMCKSAEVDLVTTDFNLYEAVGSIKPYDSIKLNKLAKLFETVQVISYKDANGKEKPVLTHERVEELRKIALTKEENKENKGG